MLQNGTVEYAQSPVQQAGDKESRLDYGSPDTRMSTELFCIFIFKIICMASVWVMSGLRHQRSRCKRSGFTGPHIYVYTLTLYSDPAPYM